MSPASSHPIRRAIGAISGTSMDGIDVALVETDGDTVVRPGPGRLYPYQPELRADLIALVADSQRAESDPASDIERRVTQAHAAAIAGFMRDCTIDPATINIVGLHGQTVFHRPERHFTRQLGLGQTVADTLGIDTVYRFRHADVAAGGQGAPLAPLYHRALAAALPQPVMVLNLGGVANVTYVDGDAVLAFDTGPASALIDDWMLKRCGLPYDDQGTLAGHGKADAAILARLLDNPYFAATPPKSLDRNDFHRRAAIVDGLGDADGAATLTAFTIESIALALAHVPQRPQRWLVGGGGRHNHMLMQGLAKRLRCAVDPVEAVGWDGDFLEAQCFGYLAVRSLRGLPLSLPSTTGVPTPLTGGEFCAART